MGRTSVNQVFTKEDWKYYNNYMDAFKRDLAVSGLSKQKQEEIYNIVGYNVQMRVATNRVGTERNSLIDKQAELIKKYKEEPNDAKARKLSVQIEELYPEIDALAKERDYFLQKFQETSARAVALDRELTDALVKQGYKIDARGRLRKGVSYRQSPTVKTRTHIKQSQTR